MDERTLARISDLRESIARIESLVSPLDEAGYCAAENWLIRDGVERRMIIIGEVLAWLRHHQPDVFARIPDASQAIALRNVIVHQYDYIDDQILWQTVSVSLPILREQVRVLSVEDVGDEND